MSKNSVVLDTNILIYYLSGEVRLKKIVEQRDHCISSITEIELCSGMHISRTQLLVIQSLLSNYEVALVNQSIHSTAVELRMKYDLKTMDAIVAATALEKNLPLFSADKRLQKVKELKFLLFTP